jgi:hypothetical protein
MDAYVTSHTNVYLGSSPGSSDLRPFLPTPGFSTTVEPSSLNTSALNPAVTCYPVYGCIEQSQSDLNKTFTSCTRQPLWVDLAAPSTVGVLVTARSLSQVGTLSPLRAHCASLPLLNPLERPLSPRCFFHTCSCRI